MKLQPDTTGSAAISNAPAALYALPASPIQQRLWRLSSSGVSSPAWNVAVRFTLAGDLSVSRFQRAVDLVLSEHEILRCSLGLSSGEVCQLLGETKTLPLEYVDLTQSKDSAGDFDRLSRSHAEKPFDLARGPLLRITLVQLRQPTEHDSVEHVLLITAHHAILDGLSVGLLSDALMEAYGSLPSWTDSSLSGPADSDSTSFVSAASEPAAPADSQLQYADYAIWFQQRQQTEEYRKHADFWKNHLSGIAVASLPQTRAASGTGRVANHIESTLLPRYITDPLQQIAKDLNATFFHVLLAAFACAMRAETGVAETVTGTPVTGRDQVELEPIIGPLVNYLPLRLAVRDTSPFVEFVEDVADITSEALSHGEYRYEDMLQLAASPDQRLFNAVFIVQRDFVHPRQAGGVTLTALPSVSPGALHDLTVFLVERADGWRLSCEIDVARHSTSFAREFLSRYRHLLQSIVVSKDEPIFNLLTTSGWDIQPITASPTSASPTLARPTLARPTLSEPAKPSSEDAPGAAALYYPSSEAQKRYWDLDRIDPGNSRLHLRVRYSVTGPVNVDAFGRAMEILTARHEALRTTFEESDQGLLQRVSSAMPAPFQHVSLSGASSGTRQPEEGSQPERLKGEHLLQAEDRLGFDLTQGPLWRALLITTSEDTALFALTMAHIISDGWSCGILTRELMEVYGALVSGHAPSLHPLSAQFGHFAQLEGRPAHQQEIARRLEYWDQLLADPLPLLNLPVDKSGDIGQSGAVCSAMIDPSLAVAIRQLARDHDVTVFNVYAAAFKVLVRRYTGVERIVFSTPIANRTPGTEEVVGPFADALLIPATIGETFEQALRISQEAMLDVFENAVSPQRLTDNLHSVGAGIGSIQLSFLYQEAFVKDIEAAGLLLKNLPNCVTEAVFDWQLAIIDRDGVVTAEFSYDTSQFTQETGQLVLEHYQRLLSQCVVAPRRQLRNFSFATEQERRAASAQQYLLPVSRRALGLEQPQPTPSVALEPAAIVVPRNLDEERMAVIWRRIFNLSAISVDADFFDLGGRSLLLARMQTAIEKEFGKRIFTADIFAAPTIASLTRRIQSSVPEIAGRAANRIIPIQPVGSQTPIFVISQSMIFRGLAQKLGPDQPMFTIQILDEDVAQRGTRTTFQQLAALYVSYLRLKQPKGPYRLGGWCVSSWIAYEMAQQLHAMGEEVEMLLLVDAYAPGYWRDLRGGSRLLAKSSYYASRFLYYAMQLAQQPAGAHANFIAERLRSAYAASLRQANRMIGRTPTLPLAIDDDHLEVLVELVVDASSRAYQASPYPDSRFLVFRSSEEPIRGFIPADMGWGRFLRTPINITVLPGDHKEIFAEAGASIMASRIGESLARLKSNLSDGRSDLAEAHIPVENMRS